MLLSQLKNQKLDRYNELQIEIESRQSEQREIQAYLQQLEGVESQMVIGVEAVQQAIAQIQEHCPEELFNYEKTIAELFAGRTVALLEESDDKEQEAGTIVTPPPQTPTEQEVQTIETTAVEIIEEQDETEQEADQKPEKTAETEQETSKEQLRADINEWVDKTHYSTVKKLTNEFFTTELPKNAKKARVIATLQERLDRLNKSELEFFLETVTAPRFEG